MVALILHGGVHDLPPDEDEKKQALAGLSEYGRQGLDLLKQGLSALDAVERIICLLEDDPSFDAGTGSFRNLNGDVEMDAIIMDSAMRCGGVQCIQHVRHPVSVARAVMEKTPHILLSGAGAGQFALANGFPYYDPSLGDNNLEDARGRVRMLRDVQYYREIRDEDRVFSTVGAVALDSAGTLVAATSTGGIRMKMPGRVGDSAIPGAGTYCTGDIGLSATGEGEGIMRLCLTHGIAVSYGQSRDLTGSCRRGVESGSGIDCICGVIAMNRQGEFTWAHNGSFMPVYCASAQVPDSV
ncbi:isoaspartyl peptidase/L-asparaginase family protein [Breznakiella homolactica]|uniref:Isoaspartyl peptidase/L-asparaginase n=1 Tax=Breznakiella homolactica TaxID=2798577 RepID=A0A7T7XRG9_9SPIR|nr:isoaspartyl peptidase/L-asparaginase family protein [Breznakiella homolactica]QQO11092.1 isoaspartyl peptidase/L-asparaginase [Breznakiella homolactica]